MHSNIASACRLYFALTQTNKTGKTNLQQGGVNGEVTSFASNKAQVLELVETPCLMKPSNFSHMISHGQEAYPVSLKRSRLEKMIVFEERNCILQFYIVNFPGKVRK